MIFTTHSTLVVLQTLRKPERTTLSAPPFNLAKTAVLEQFLAVQSSRSPTKCLYIAAHTFLDAPRRYWSVAMDRTSLDCLREERKLFRKRYIPRKWSLSMRKAAQFRDTILTFWRAAHTFLGAPRIPLNDSVARSDQMSPDKERKLSAQRYISRSKFRRHPPSWHGSKWVWFIGKSCCWLIRIESNRIQ